jgi:hypothetical protein
MDIMLIGKGRTPTMDANKGPLEPTGRLGTMPGFFMVEAMTSGSSLSFAAPLVEEVAVSALGLQSRLDRRSGDRLIEEA